MKLKKYAVTFLSKTKMTLVIKNNSDRPFNDFWNRMPAYVISAKAEIYFKNKKLNQLDSRLNGHDGVVSLFC